VQLIRLVAISSLLLTACVTPPTKPVVEICFPQILSPLDTSYCYCGMSEPDNAPMERKPLSHCDKGTAFPPESWERVQLYIHAMEDYIQRSCK
jgi:hypothetical protein